MFKNHLLMAWRNLLKHKVYGTVLIAGLAIGMAGCLLIAFWVQDERRFDQFHENGARVYRIVSDWEKYSWDGMPGTPSPLAEAVRTQLPEIQGASRIAWQDRRVFRYEDKTFYESRGLIVDPEFFAMLSFPLVRGEGATALSGPEDILMTETTAGKYFGSEDPVGKTIEVEGQPWVVRGILKDIPRHSSLQFDYVNSFQYIDRLSGYARGWGAFNFGTILLLNPGAEPTAIGPKLTEIARAHECPQVLTGVQFRLQPLADLHFAPQTGAGPGMVLGDAASLSLFSWIAVFILVIACLNFVNLSTARLGIRGKEVGLRKTFGAGRAAVVRRFLGESSLLVAAAAVIALLLATLLIPAFNRLAGKSLTLDLFQPGTLGLLLAVIGFTGLAAGLFPALAFAAIRPVRALKNELDRGGRGGLFRNILVVFQFALSLILLISTIVVIRQFRFMQKADLGFARDNVVQIPVKENIGPSYEAFKAGLLRDPAVRAVTGQSYSFAETTQRSSGNFDWEGRDPNNNLDMVYTGVDYDYFETMGMHLVDGRSFSRDRGSDAGRAVILNETAIRKMGIKDPVGKRFSVSPEEAGLIIGVVADARFRTFHHEVDPCIFYISEIGKRTATGLVMVRIEGARTREAIGHLRRVWTEFNPQTPFEYRFLDETYAGLYRDDQRRTEVFRVFSILAVFVAVLGLLGLAAFMTERRTREIGIRKVLGAAEAGIAASMARRMTSGVLAANLLAWPAAYFAAKRLLEKYIYRIDLDIWTFALPALAVFVLAFTAVGLLTLRAANADPVKALRYE